MHEVQRGPCGCKRASRSELAPSGRSRLWGVASLRGEAAAWDCGLAGCGSPGVWCRCAALWWTRAADARWSVGVRGREPACACGRSRTDRVEGSEHLAERAATRRRSQMGCDGRVDAGDCSARESRRSLRHARECGVPVSERGLGTRRESGGCPVCESARDGCLRLGYERVARERDACSRVSGRAGLWRSCVAGGCGSVRVRVATWLILPVVICLSQRLSHACLSINAFIL